MPQTPLENLIAKSLRARLTQSPLLLDAGEVEDLCEILQKYVSALSNRGRKRTATPTAATLRTRKHREKQNAN